MWSWRSCRLHLNQLLRSTLASQYLKQYHLKHANPHKTVSPQHIRHWCEGKNVFGTLITAAFKPLLEINTDRANNITEAICLYISTSMCPHALAEDPSFKYLSKVLEQRYSVPSHAHISQSASTSSGGA